MLSSNEAVDRAIDDIGTVGWRGLDLKFCREAYGVEEPWAASAIEAWSKIPRAAKHPGGHPSQAPRGAILYYAGGSNGFCALAVGTGANCIAVDYCEDDNVALAPRTLDNWNLKYLGWSTWTPAGQLTI